MYAVWFRMNMSMFAELCWQAYGDKVNSKKDVGDTLSVEVTNTTRATVLKREEASGLGTVIENRLLTKAGVPAKHHIRQCFALYHWSDVH